MTDLYGEVFPNVRCIGCGKVTGALYDRYVELVVANVDQTEIWKSLGIRRTCCMLELMRPPKIVDNLNAEPISILSGDPDKNNLRTKKGRMNNNLAVLAMGNTKRKTNVIDNSSDKPITPFTLSSINKTRKKKSRSRFKLTGKNVIVAPGSTSGTTPTTPVASTSESITVPASTGEREKINLSALRSTKKIKLKFGINANK